MIGQDGIRRAGPGVERASGNRAKAGTPVFSPAPALNDAAAGST